MRYSIILFAAAATFSLVTEAKARECTSSGDRTCWVTARSSAVVPYDINADAVAVTTGVVCSLEVGSLDPMTGIATNRNVMCERPVGSCGRTPVGAPLAPAKIKSIALANPGVAILGPVTLYALGTDNNLYYANADSHFASGTDYFPSNFSLYGQTLDTTGTLLNLTQITTDRAPDGSTHVLGVSSTNNIYLLSGARWSLYKTNYTIAYGDSRGAIGLQGTSPSGHQVLIFDETLTSSAPNIPSTQTLALSGSNFVYLQAATKPFGLGSLEAYFLSNSTDPTTRLYQSKDVGGVWGAWNPYLNLADGYPQSPPSAAEPLPWSVADASFFHAYTNGRGTTAGELFFIGSFSRLYEYVP